MELKHKLFAILAVFCVICSACAVSAADGISDETNDYYLDGSHDGHDGLIIPPDYAHNEAFQAAGGDVNSDVNQSSTGVPSSSNNTQTAMNVTANNMSANAAGGDVTATAGNSTNATATHTMPATGNPIVALLAVSAVLGGYAVLRRR